MRFLRSTAELLAEHLRDAIESGELAEPLPGIRPWSQQLGVSRDSLARALRVLQRGGLITVHRNGVRLNPVRQRPPAGRGPRLVRVIYHGFPSLHEDLDWIESLSESLHRHEVQLTLERCNAKRLRALTHAPTNRNELLILSALPETYQRLLVDRRMAALLIGLPSAQAPLPFITVDQEPAVRHATQRLLRQGFGELDLLNFRFPSAGTARVAAAFAAACREWSPQPVRVGRFCCHWMRLRCGPRSNGTRNR